MVFFATRNLYEGVTDSGNDRDNHADISGGPEDFRDSDKGAEAGISK